MSNHLNNVPFFWELERMEADRLTRCNQYVMSLAKVDTRVIYLTDKKMIEKTARILYLEHTGKVCKIKKVDALLFTLSLVTHASSIDVTHLGKIPRCTKFFLSADYIVGSYWSDVMWFNIIFAHPYFERLNTTNTNNGDALFVYQNKLRHYERR